jgi:Ca2+/Na+ antiporter
LLLEVTGNDLANRLGINGVIFGATVLATATALPEISSGLAAVRLGDNSLAMGDIFGGNAFQVCLFLVADLVAGKPVLESAGNLNAWLGALGAALTAIYGFGVIARPLRPGHRRPLLRPALDRPAGQVFLCNRLLLAFLAPRILRPAGCPDEPSPRL